MDDNLYPVQKDPAVNDQKNNPMSGSGKDQSDVDPVDGKEEIKVGAVSSAGNDLPKISDNSDEEEDTLKTSTETINDLEDITESYMEDTAF